MKRRSLLLGLSLITLVASLFIWTASNRNLLAIRTPGGRGFEIGFCQGEIDFNYLDTRGYAFLHPLVYWESLPPDPVGSPGVPAVTHEAFGFGLGHKTMFTTTTIPAWFVFALSLASCLLQARRLRRQQRRPIGRGAFPVQTATEGNSA